MRLQNRQRKLKVDSAGLRALMLSMLAGEEVDPRAQVEVVLLRDEPMARLNARYRNRPRPTDVLSFPSDLTAWPPGEPPLLGTVLVSVDRAAVQAADRRLAPGQEIQRLVAHGFLHLVGYRDDTPRRRSRMRRRENHYLRLATEGR